MALLFYNYTYLSEANYTIYFESGDGIHNNSVIVPQTCLNVDGKVQTITNVTWSGGVYSMVIACKTATGYLSLIGDGNRAKYCEQMMLVNRTGHVLNFSAYYSNQLITSTDVNWYINGSFYGTANPLKNIQIPFFPIDLNVSIQPIGNVPNYKDIKKTISFPIYEYNFSLGNPMLTINFSQNSDGYILSRDLNYFRVFNWTNLNQITKNLSDIPNTLIYIYARKTGTSNNYQVLEYNNDGTSNITDTLQILDTPNFELWTNTVDNAGNPRSDMLVKIYQYSFSWNLGTQARLVGQRYGSTQYGNNKALTQFWIDGSLPATAYNVSGTNYQSITGIIIPQLSNYTRDTPLQITINPTEMSNKIATISCPKHSSTAKNETIICTVYYNGNENIYINTDYRISQGLTKKQTSNNNPLAITQNGNLFGNSQYYNQNYINTLIITTDIHYFTLDPNVDYNPSLANTTETIYLYEGDTIIGTYTINFDYVENTQIGNINDQTKDNDFFKFLLFWGLIFITVISQFFFSSKVGKHTFLIGGIILSFINIGFLMFSFVCLCYYLLGFLKPVTGALN